MRDVVNEHLLPVILTLNRVKSQKKRRPYLDQLTGMIEQGKWIQLAALNLATNGAGYEAVDIASAAGALL